MILADTGVSTPLKLQLKDGATGKGVRAKVKSASGTVLATVNCPHIGDGTYVGTYTFSSDGNYIAVFTVYTDATYNTVDLGREITSEDYKAQTSSSPANIANLVWEELLAGHTTPGSAGAAITQILNRDIPAEVWNALAAAYNLPNSMGEIMNMLRDFDPSAIASSVWDESVFPHQIPNTFGDYIHVIRQYTRMNNDVLTDGTFGLDALHHDINHRASLIEGEINQNEVKIDAILPALGAVSAHLTTEIGDVRNKVVLLSAQLTAAQASIIAAIAARDPRFDSLDSAVAAIQNNTTVRFIVPERLVKPESGTKQYQFHLRLFDSLGNPEAPDSTPTLRIRRLDSGADIVLAAPMTPDGAKVGAYFYVFSISAGTDEYPALVEATVVENGVARYIPAVSEITEFEADLDQIQSQLSDLQITTTGIDLTVHNPTYGLPAIKINTDQIIAEVNQNEAKIDLVKADTLRIPTSPATSQQVADAEAAALSRPSMAQIDAALDFTRDEIRGSDGRTITDVYDRWDISTLAKTNDPRFNNLDAPVSSRSTLTAAQVWGFGTRTLTSFDLSDDNVAKVWAFLISQATTPGSFGERVAGFLDVPVSTRATQSQVASLLSGVAQESTVSALHGVITTLAAENQIRVQQLLDRTLTIVGKTNLLPSDPASQSAIDSQFDQLDACCADLGLKVDQIKTKTDNLPVDPARQISVLQIPTNPVLATDVRLTNLDAKISTRSTLQAADLAPLAKEATLISARNVILDAIEDVDLGLSGVETKVSWIWSKVYKLPSDPASDSRIAQAENTILDALPSAGGSVPCAFNPDLVADRVWVHSSRTLTTPFPDTSHLATKADVSSVGPQYINRMSTAFNDSTGDQEMIVWMEKNGQRLSGTSSCAVAIYSAVGALQWSGSASSPNAHGIFKFVHPIAAQADANYYVIISMVADGSPRETTQSFVTIG